MGDLQPCTGKSSTAQHWSITARSTRYRLSSRVLVSSISNGRASWFWWKSYIWSLSKRNFHGPDGVTYTWSIGGPTSCVSRPNSLPRQSIDLLCILGQLHVQDENGVKRRVVRMQQRNIFTGKKPHLDIDPSVLHILDLIIITWVYMETKRRERN